MKKIIATISLLLIICSLFSKDKTPTTLYGCFAYFDEVFTEEEKTNLINLDTKTRISLTLNINYFIKTTKAYKEGKLDFLNEINKELMSNIVPKGYPGLHFEDYTGMIYKSYFYLLKCDDCRWDFLLKAYAPMTLYWEYGKTGVLRTVYPDNITNDDLKVTKEYSFNYYSERVFDTILFFKNSLNETYIYSFAYSWRKIPEKDFDDFINGHSEISLQTYFDELFKDSPFIGGL